MELLVQPLTMVFRYRDNEKRLVDATCTYTGTGYQWIVHINEQMIGGIMQDKWSGRYAEHPLMFLNFRTAILITIFLEDEYRNRDTQFIK